MKATGQRDTTPELALRSALHRRGLRFRVDVAPLADLRRRADVVFRAERLAVFVDGCFWHGCPQHATWPQANGQWWRDKIEGNRARDTDTNQRLADAGWTVVRVWEHEDLDRAVERVVTALTGCRRREVAAGSGGVSHLASRTVD
jgi:DNA mismatch endonuclease, patch repair protein